jgi:hypothetical protein
MSEESFEFITLDSSPVIDGRALSGGAGAAADSGVKLLFVPTLPDEIAIEEKGHYTLLISYKNSNTENYVVKRIMLVKKIPFAVSGKN